MNTRFKVFNTYNTLQYLCDFIHVLIFVTVLKCRKSPKLTNTVINVNVKLNPIESTPLTNKVNTPIHGIMPQNTSLGVNHGLVVQLV